MLYYVGNLGAHGLVAFAWAGQLTPRVEGKFFGTFGPFATSAGAAYFAQTGDTVDLCGPESWDKRAEESGFIACEPIPLFDELDFGDRDAKDEGYGPVEVRDPAASRKAFRTEIAGFPILTLYGHGFELREATSRPISANFHINLVNDAGGSLWCTVTRAEFDAVVEVLGWTLKPAQPLSVEQAAEHLEAEQARSSVAEVRSSHLHIDPEGAAGCSYDLASQHVAGAEA